MKISTDANGHIIIDTVSGFKRERKYLTNLKGHAPSSIDFCLWCNYIKMHSYFILEDNGDSANILVTEPVFLRRFKFQVFQILIVQ